MKKNMFAICDLEASYACRLTDYLNNRKITPFEVQAFTSVESLVNYVKDHPVEILLISAGAFRDELKELPIKKIVILSDGEMPEEAMPKEYPSVYKYQSSDTLVSEVMEYYADSGEAAAVLPQYYKNGRIYSVYSPLGRCRKTTFALTLGEILAETKKTLYLNLETLSGFEKLTGQTSRYDLSDVLYFFKQNDGTLIYRWNAMVQTMHSLQYIFPAEVPSVLREMSGEDWVRFLGELIHTMEYEAVVLDIGNMIADVEDILEKSARIFMPVMDDRFSAAKLSQLERLLQMPGRERIASRITRIHPPAQLLREEQDFLRQLVWGEMGKYVRELLKKEEDA